MGRPTKGFRIRDQHGSSTKSVVFTHNGKEIERTTGERDPVRAAEVGAQIYAAVVRGTAPPKPKRATKQPADTLTRLGEQWLESQRGILDDTTIATYALYFETHLAPFFGSLEMCSPERVRLYSKERLAKVGAGTVRKELSCLRGLWLWQHPEATQGEALAAIPGIPKRVKGARFHKRRRGKATELSPAEVAAFLSQLPEWSRLVGGVRHPIRARFIVAYETGLRPATIDTLSVPENWAPGKTSLRFADDQDKARYGREVPLTRAALVALASVAPRAGLIFGAHDYTFSVRSAARRAGLLDHRVATLAPYDMRHNRATHLLERTSNVAGVQALLGHKHVSTTAKYVKASVRAARAVVEELGAAAAAATIAEPSPVVASSTAGTMGSRSAPPADSTRGPGDEGPPFGFG